MNLPDKLLTEEHLTQLNNAQEIFKWADNQIELASRAGIPMDEHKEKLKAAKEKVANLKQVYFPGR